MSIYHYTTGAHIHQILADGYLKLTPSPERLFPGERPLVWLTTDTDMPPTALKPMRLGDHIHYPTIDELCQYANIYRFTMPEGLKTHRWGKILKSFGADSSLADVAERLGEDPRTWRATTKRIKVLGLRLEVRQMDGTYLGVGGEEITDPGIPVEQY